ncbi:outer membrane protein assembly factor BamE [Thermodesulfobacteriota bacterium]
MMQARIYSVLTISVAVVVLLFFSSRPLPAQPEELARLQQQIEQLERRLQKLESFLRISDESHDKKAEQEYGWQNKKNWRLLKAGMTESQVKTILGEPTKVIKGVKTLWYYPSIYSGHISFDKNGQVTGWNEP